jgi:hypothetical protein
MNVLSVDDSSRYRCMVGSKQGEVKGVNRVKDA